MNKKEYFEKDNKNGKKSNEKWLSKNNPKLYNDIINYCISYNIETEKFIEKIWYYINNITVVQKCYCGNNVKFNNLKAGFRLTCSVKCSGNSPDKREKMKQTNIKRYGVEHALQVKEFSEKAKQTTLDRYGVEYASQSDVVKEKIKHTNLERYGVEHTLQVKEFSEKAKQTTLDRYGVEYSMQSKEVKEKAKKTNLERYGVEHALQVKEFSEKAKQTTLDRYGVEYASQSDIVREKIKHTNLERYGFENPFMNDDIKKKIKDTNIEKYGVENYCQSDIFKEEKINYTLSKIPEYTLLGINEEEIEMQCIKSHLFSIDLNLLRKRIYYGYEPCIICNPTNSYSYSENEIGSFLEDNRIEFEKNSRKILRPYELDIYSSSKNVAIEYNGLYWHSDVHKSDNYHLKKTEDCLQLGVQLIHIFEDEWMFKKEIVQSRLLNIMGKTPTKIYARKCTIEKVNTQDSRAFLNKNHIQGYVNANINYGLYHNGELVSLMTFGKLRKNLGSKHKDGYFELLRFCNKLNTNIIGGASKLFKHFIKNNNYDKIISYADRRWSQGDLYYKLGFEKIGTSRPNYFYVKNLSRENRFKYRKSELVKEGFDENLTEREIMKQRGYHRIYDCGTYKFEYKNKQK